LVLHVADVDPKTGLPVDARFKEVATAITPTVIAYRKTDLRDDSVRADLAESAIYSTNRSLKGKSCDNLEAYVLTSFRRRVDAYVKRSERIVSYDAVPHGCSLIASVPQTGENAEINVELAQALKRMSPDLRYLVLRRLRNNDSPKAIARDVATSPEAVSVQLSRGLSVFRKFFNSKRPRT
jgi:DNA-directed RNA polymerase specialized sigma24 family protein